MGEEIIIQDENGKKYSVLRVLDADTKKIIDDLSALVVKKDKMIDLMAEDLKTPINSKEWIIEYYKKRCEDAKD